MRFKYYDLARYGVRLIVWLASNGRVTTEFFRQAAYYFDSQSFSQECATSETLANLGIVTLIQF